MGKTEKKFAIVIMLGAFFLFSLSSCFFLPPIKIGMAASLTGRYSDLGIQGRNGAVMAVEEINENGGITGRKIDFIIKDDFGTVDGALAADEELVAEGTRIILGHMLSDLSLAAQPYLEENDTILVSPTTSTPLLSGKKDNFFRIIPINTTETIALAKLIYHQNSKQIIFLYDRDNTGYTTTFKDTFSQTYQELGGEIIEEISFQSTENPDFLAIIQQMRTKNPDAVVIVASALDTALIAQYIRIDNWDVPLYTSGWGLSGVLIENGGQAVEGIMGTIHFNPDSKEPRYLAFKERYIEDYDVDPSFAAVYSYEVIYYLAEALEACNSNLDQLPQAMTEVGTFEGLFTELTMDAYGDIDRPPQVVVIQHGELITLENDFIQ